MIIIDITNYKLYSEIIAITQFQMGQSYFPLIVSRATSAVEPHEYMHEIDLPPFNQTP